MEKFPVKNKVVIENQEYKKPVHSILTFPYLVNPDFTLSGRPTNEFKQHAPRVLSEMPDTDACQHGVLSGISEQFCGSVQKHNASKRKITSFYEVTVKIYTKSKFIMLHY